MYGRASVGLPRVRESRDDGVAARTAMIRCGDEVLPSRRCVTSRDIRYEQDITSPVVLRYCDERVMSAQISVTFYVREGRYCSR